MTTKPVFLQASWSAPANIHTCITTSIGNFNPANHVNDNPDVVAANRALLQRQLGGKPAWLNQTHSTEVINLDANATSQDADASYTTHKGKICVVMTADCLPILLSNLQGEFVAAIHAGWRGLNDGIIENTLDKLNTFNPEEMIAFIGPAICQHCFEVGQEVKEAFINKDTQTGGYFKEGRHPEKQHANLRGIAEHKLVNLGLTAKNISNRNVCTKCNPGWFYSYRANPQTGRVATLIWKT